MIFLVIDYFHIALPFLSVPVINTGKQKKLQETASDILKR